MAKGSSGGGAHFCHNSQNSWRISSYSEQILSGEDPSLAGLSSSPLQVLWVTVFPEPQQGSVGGEDESFQGISHAKELSLPQARLCPALQPSPRHSPRKLFLSLLSLAGFRPQPFELQAGTY